MGEDKRKQRGSRERSGGEISRDLSHDKGVTRKLRAGAVYADNEGRDEYTSENESHTVFESLILTCI